MLVPLIEDIIDTAVVVVHLGFNNSFERLWEFLVLKHFIINFLNVVDQLNRSWKLIFYHDLSISQKFIIHHGIFAKECVSSFKVAKCLVNLQLLLKLLESEQIVKKKH